MAVTLEKDSLFIITRGHHIGTEKRPFGDHPIYDRSYDGYVYKVIEIEGNLNLVVAEVVHVPAPSYLHTEFVGTRRLVNLAQVLVTQLPQRMFDALRAAPRFATKPLTSDWGPSVMPQLKTQHWASEEFDRMAKKAALEAERHQQQIAQGLEKDPTSVPPTDEKSEQ